MSKLPFYPELLERRAEANLELNARGFEWLSHYSSVKALHDRHGIEVCGIRSKEDACRIMAVLKQLFPAWRSNRVTFKYWGNDRGWTSRLCRKPRTKTKVACA